MNKNYPIPVSKTLVLIIVVLLILLSQRCTKPSPSKAELIGTWESPDGALFIFKDDGKFIGKSLPAYMFSFTSEDGAKVDGSGRWEIDDEYGPWKNGSWKVNLRFVYEDATTGSYYIYIEGSNGFFADAPPWYLFRWKEEEGGERYIFRKKN